MNRLARHEAAQLVSRAQKEANGARTLSFSTKEVMDYLCIEKTAPGGLSVSLVEIKTGESHLSARQREFVKHPPLPVMVEHWTYKTGDWVLHKRREYAP